MKNNFYFTLKVPSFIKRFNFFFSLFGHVEKLLDYKNKASFKIYDVTPRLTNNCNIHIAQYFKK